MANGYVVEFADLPSYRNAVMAKWDSRVVEQSPVSFTTSAQSAAFASTTRYIMFTADAAFHWTIGSDPTATTSKMRFAADTIYHIQVQPGDKIAFIAA